MEFLPATAVMDQSPPGKWKATVDIFRWFILYWENPAELMILQSGRVPPGVANRTEVKEDTQLFCAIGL